jgi:hypothetical protein
MWSGGSSHRYGREANVGDVVGCEADLDRKTLRWSLNGDFGSPMGSCGATENIDFVLGLTPAVTLQGLTIVASGYRLLSLLPP